MKLLVVGATGTLGRQVAKCALEEGHQVRCLVRSFQRAAFLREWGAELVRANLCVPETLPPALEGMEAVIDAAAARPTDSLSIREVDWEGKLALIQAAQKAKIDRFMFYSILHADKFPHVPLMDIKRCTEAYLAQSGLPYTTLQLGGFFQGLIGQYAIPILEEQAVWVTGESTPTAYMDTQDVARLTLRALVTPETQGRTLPLVGPRAWTSAEIIKLCERLSGKQAKVTQVPLGVIRAGRQVLRSFQWTWNIADRLAFAEVLAGSYPFTAPMEEIYTLLGANPSDTTTLEAYLQEYFGRILKKLKELTYEQEKQKRKKKKPSPFKT